MASKGLKDAQLDEAPDTLDPASLGLKAPSDGAPDTIDPTEMKGLSNSVVVDQNMPEDLSAYHRFVVKNFSNSPESSIKYLKERYPDYEIVHDQNNILMRKPGEEKFKTLDPNQPISERLSNPIGALKEGAMDLGDIAYDVPAGIASTAASAAAGLAGGAATGGTAALPSAMGAGGAASGGLEALRQKLGAILGIPQEVNKGDVALSGAVGTVMPLAFGTGAGPAMVAKEALKKGMTQEAAQELLNSQSGAIGRMLPYAGQAMSGIPADTLRTARNRLPEIKDLEQDGITDLVSGTQAKLAQAIRQAKKQTGENLASVIDNADEKVNISEAKSKLMDYLAELEGKQKELPNEALKDEIGVVKDNIKNIFSGEATPPAAASKLLDASGQPAEAAKEAVETQIPNEISASAAFKLQDQLKDLSNFSKRSGGLTSRNANSPVSTQMLENKARDAYDALNSELERVTDRLDGPNSQDLKNQYRQHSQLQETLGKFFKDPESTYNTLRNLGKPQKKVLLETLNNVDSQLGTNTVSDAKLLDAYLRVGKNSLPPSGAIMDIAKTRGGAAGAGATIGGALGYENGGTPGAIAGSGLGAGAGLLLGSPAAMRLGIGMNRSLSVPARQIPMPIWNMIQSHNQQNEENR